MHSAIFRVVPNLNRPPLQTAAGFCMQVSPLVVLLDIAEGVSRVHASRRIFELLQRHNIKHPVLHHLRFPVGASR